MTNTEQSIAKVIENTLSLEEYKKKKIWACHEKKVPKNAMTGGNASCNSPNTWATHKRAVQGLKEHPEFSGLMVALGNGLMGIDLDHVRNAKTEEVCPEALDIIKKFDTYTEISYSGTGFHLLVNVDTSQIQRVTLPAGYSAGWANPSNDGKDTGIEYYHPFTYGGKLDGGRFFSYTENIFDGHDEIRDCTNEVKSFMQVHKPSIVGPDEEKKENTPRNTPMKGEPAKVSDDLLKRLKKREKLWKLYSGDLSDYGEDDSDVDYAFAMEALKFFKGDKDKAYDLYWSSALVREKSYTPRGATNYWGYTLDNAFNAYTQSNVPKVKATKPFFPQYEDNNKPAYDDEAEKLIKELHIKRIGGDLHAYQEGAYVKADTSRKDLVASTLASKYRTTMKDRSEVKALVETTCPVIEKTADPRYILFNNGIYDVKKDVMMDFDPDIVITNKIPHDYKPDATSEFLDKWLDDVSVNDSEVKAVLEEIAGYCFYRATPLRRGLIYLTGNGSNGKSTYIKFLKEILGAENCCNVDPRYSDPDVNRFRTLALEGKLANLPDDASHNSIKDTSSLKKYITGEDQEVEGKGTQARTISSYATWVVSVNSMPMVRDDGGATTDRMLLIPFDANFPKEGPDARPDIPDLLAQEEVVEAMIAKGIEGLKRILKVKSFTIPAKSVEAMKTYRNENDSVMQFLDDWNDRGCEIWNQSVDDVYVNYTIYCSQSGITSPLRKIQFGKRLKDLTGANNKVQKVNGKAVRIYVRA